MKVYAIVFLLFVPMAFARAQDDAVVTSLVARTSDSVELQVSALHKRAKGNGLSIAYTVTNRGRSSVYLVLDPVTNVRIIENLIFQIIPAVVPPDDHHPFNFRFIKVSPGSTYKGVVSVSPSFVVNSGLQNLSSATIEVGFSYLYDVSHFGGCRETTYRLPCLQSLYDKAKSLIVGQLVIRLD